MLLLLKLLLQKIRQEGGNIGRVVAQPTSFFFFTVKEKQGAENNAAEEIINDQTGCNNRVIFLSA